MQVAFRGLNEKIATLLVNTIIEAYACIVKIQVYFLHPRSYGIGIGWFVNGEVFSQANAGKTPGLNK
jgi:hypothetical protein